MSHTIDDSFARAAASRSRIEEISSCRRRSLGLPSRRSAIDSSCRIARSMMLMAAWVVARSWPRPFSPCDKSRIGGLQKLSRGRGSLQRALELALAPPFSAMLPPASPIPNSDSCYSNVPRTNSPKQVGKIRRFVEADTNVGAKVARFALPPSDLAPPRAPLRSQPQRAENLLIMKGLRSCLQTVDFPRQRRLPTASDHKLFAD